MLMALKKGQNALLEAPTGCGKTLSLLCAALAWQEARRAEITAQQLQVPPAHDPLLAMLTSLAPALLHAGIGHRHQENVVELSGVLAQTLAVKRQSSAPDGPVAELDSFRSNVVAWTTSRDLA
jgi:hypothetical protein